MESAPDRTRKRFILLAGVILVPGVVLAILSWRSFEREAALRRGEVRELAVARTRAALSELDAELRQIRDQGWTETGETSTTLLSAGADGSLVSVKDTSGRFLYPSRARYLPPTLEERLRRENPLLLRQFFKTVELEFAKGRPLEAVSGYRALAESVESPPTRATLLHAALRAASRAGDAEGVKLLAEKIAREHPDVLGASGIPYGAIARARLLETDGKEAHLDAFLQSLASGAVPGHARSLLLRDLTDPASEANVALARAVSDAHALEVLEDALEREENPGDRLLWIDGARYLLTFGEIPGGSAGIAIPTGESFPGAAGRAGLSESEGLAFELSDSAATVGAEEILYRAVSTEFVGLEVSARLTDPSRLEIPRGRLWLTGGIVICLLASLVFGLVTLVRSVGRELAVARMKSDFVSGVSHDLKTPLTSIRMFAEMLEGDKAGDPQKRREYYRIIHRESVRLSRMVENVLDFSRIEDGRKTFSFDVHDLGGIVRSSAEAFQAQLDGQDARFEADIPSERMDARVDPDALGGAILNLLENAAKYGGPHAEIRLRLARKGDAAEISVSDTGPGVAASERERVFEKFFRGEAARTGPQGGAGLGLSLVRHAVEAHGGTISLDPKPGPGARFILTLPLCRESSS